MARLIAPNGLEIWGTFELCPGCAEISGDITRNAKGEIEYDHAGGTEFFYDDMKTQERDGKTIFLDTEGNEWTEDQLVEAEDDEEEDAA